MTKHVGWIIAALGVYNAAALASGVHRVLISPDKAVVYLTSHEVNVSRNVADGSPMYEVSLPLKEFPFDAQLQQDHRSDLLWVSSVNLLLTAALFRASRSKATPVKPFTILGKRGEPSLGGPSAVR
jgi:hypothetical protein